MSDDNAQGAKDNSFSEQEQGEQDRQQETHEENPSGNKNTNGAIEKALDALEEDVSAKTRVVVVVGPSGLVQGEKKEAKEEKYVEELEDEHHHDHHSDDSKHDSLMETVVIQEGNDNNNSNSSDNVVVETDARIGMPVAEPVQEFTSVRTEDTQVLQVAEGYNESETTDASRHLWKNERFKRLVAVTALGFLVVALLIVILLAVLVFPSSEEEQERDLSKPFDEEKAILIRDYLEYVLGENHQLDDPESPQARAFNWITREDPLELTVEAENLLQRYLFALFYLDTSRENRWRSCNAALPNETALCNFTYLTSYFPTSSYLLEERFRWLSESHECNWGGIVCDLFLKGFAIALPGMEITSTFPTEMAKLPDVAFYRLPFNNFYGSLPTELPNREGVWSVEFHYNLFTGTVPPEWFSYTTLRRINVLDNQLYGTIPTTIGQLTELLGIYVGNNDISGTIPTEVGNLGRLQYIGWRYTRTTGTLPSEIGKLSNILELWLHRSNLTGTLPTEFGRLTSLEALHLNHNGLNGTLHDEHFQMQNLTYLNLYSANFSGTVDSKISKLTSLEILRIHNNHFSGTIPSELGLISSLKWLRLHFNDFHGSVPSEICAWRGNFGLSDLTTDCRSVNNTDEPHVLCECCTACCNRADMDCVITT